MTQPGCATFLVPERLRFSATCVMPSHNLSSPPSVGRILEELPEMLDETYEWVLLREIKKANREHAHHLLQCLTVALRPLHAEELAEISAIEFNTPSRGGIPQLNPNWRWVDQHQAVLSTCSSLIAIIDNGDSRVVQFSHFSDTSPRIGWPVQAGMFPVITSSSNLHTQSWHRPAWVSFSGWTIMLIRIMSVTLLLPNMLPKTGSSMRGSGTWLHGYEM